MIEILVLIAILGLIFGVVYPICAILFYPIYKIFIEDISFREYLRSI